MSTGGTRRPDSDDWADGGRRARPRYLTLQAPSPPAPNGHQGGVRGAGSGVRGAGSGVRGAGSGVRGPERGDRTPNANRRTPPLLARALAALLLLSATVVVAWVLWRLAVAGG